MKLVEENPEDRYADIFQLKDAISALIIKKSQIDSQMKKRHNLIDFHLNYQILPISLQPLLLMYR